MTTIARGDVILIDFPQQSGSAPKRRPALVVQSDHNNTRLSNSIFAMITSNTKLAGAEPTQVLIDISTAEGKQSGLVHTSAVKCENIYTLPINSVHRKLGSLPASLMQQVEDALKASLDLP
jgi:mRNA interferase MazF